MLFNRFFNRPDTKSDTPDISKLIDRRNKDIWESVQKKFTITIAFHNSSEHLLHTKGSIAAISIPRNGYSKEGFTHEILHLYLAVNNLNLGDQVYELMVANRFATLFDVNLMTHIANTIDHSIMLPFYLQAGFKKELFILDDTTPKCNETEMQLIELAFSQGSFIRKLGVNYFLGKYFGMKACTNKQFEYTSYIDRLKNTNAALFDVLENLWKALADLNSNSENLKSIAIDFVNELDNWITNDSISDDIQPKN